MRHLEGLFSLQHGEIMCVFPNVPLPAILLGLLDFYSKSRDSKSTCSCFLGGVCIKFDPCRRFAGSQFSFLAVQGRKCVANDCSQLPPPEPGLGMF